MYPFFIRTGGASLLVTVAIWFSFSSDSFSNVSNFAKVISHHSGSKEQLVDASASNHTFVTLIAAVSKRTFRLDEPIVLSCVLSNQSVAPVTIWFSGFWANHMVTVRDASGVEPPLTTVGAMRRALFAPAGPRFKTPHIALNPAICSITSRRSSLTNCTT